MYLATCKIRNKQYTSQTTDSLRSRWITTNLRVENLIGMKNVSKNVFTVMLKVRDITVFWKMFQLLLSIKLMTLIPRKGRLF